MRVLEQLEALGMAATLSELADLLGQDEGVVLDHLRVIEDWGQVREDGDRWRVTVTEWIAGEPFQYDKKIRQSEGEPDWILPSPFKVTNLRVGDYVIDAYVRHEVHADEKGEPVFGSAEVVAISKLVRADGEPLGAQNLRLNLRAVAVEAVVKASRLVILKVPTDSGNGPAYVAFSGGDAWRKQAHEIRRLARGQGGSRWTPEQNEWLMTYWRHLHESGHGTQADLAFEIGLHPDQVREKLRRLRRRYGSELVPEGKHGRPSKRKDEE